MASKAFSKSLLSFYCFLRRRLYNPLFLHRRTPHGSHLNKFRKSLPNREQLLDRTLVFDVEGGLLRSSSTFPYFMLVALEAGGFLRGLLLLVLYPLLCCLSRGVGLRVMVMVCFFGIRKEGLRVGKAVLPKFFLQDLGLEGFEVLRRARRRVCYTRMPRVMVEGFLKDYLGVEVVVGRELKEFGGYCTGLMEEEGEMEMETKVLFGEEDTGGGSFGIGSCTNSSRHCLFSHCKEVHLVTEAEKRTWHALPREQYPKPLVFHDGRVAFRPTPMNTLLMFLWLPLGVPLTIFRSSIFLLLPYRISIPIGAFSGMKSRLATPQTLGTERQPHARGHLYVCNHRTLLDPIYISAALRKPVTAVTYSISPISEALSPIRTVRLTRNKEEDGRRMARLLNQGDLVVCPEGTTCREPYLLRFSPLFAELTDTVIPVALVTRVSMFYGTTAAGFKFLDPFYFLANPCPEYDVEFLGNVSTTHSIAGKSCSSHGVANHVQRKIGDALGFECTTLTRKDKYLMLAGNEGIVNTAKKTVMQNLRII
ncbi:probable glycerol-3-phosphate acyltransferase 3 [Phoenix dactylifera]|uniref:Probable glycerol-3-phosphate acyltransferase 3 n=1 Tax=Phoenix dactylifera TaxID=42345 RepID=A0A8B9AQW9_PHODC|nr:probable glycerol-3-phosphate acyltransferase 3 [Phoenix dactylifera]